MRGDPVFLPQIIVSDQSVLFLVFLFQPAGEEDIIKAVDGLSFRNVLIEEIFLNQ